MIYVLNAAFLHLMQTQRKQQPDMVIKELGFNF